MFLTYILGVAWLGVFGFSAVPVFLFYNMWSTCATMRSNVANLTNIDSICVDVRQYGERGALGPGPDRVWIAILFYFILIFLWII